MALDAKDYKMFDYKTITCLGDSITAGYWDEEGLGWPSRLSQKIAKSHPYKFGIYNIGISGDTTQDGWHNMISRVPHFGTDFLVIALGTNDVCVREGIEPEEQRFSPINRIQKWHEILDFTHSMGWKTLVIGPIPVEADIIRFPAHDDLVPGHKSSRFEQKELKQYNDVLEDLAQKKNVPFLRVFEEWVGKLEEGLFADGLHPNAKGHEMLSTQVFQKIKTLGWLENA